MEPKMRSETMNLKQERINLRLNNMAKTVLERAASFEGKSVSNFILSCALKQAEKTIHAHETMQLGQNDAAAFLTALSQPVQFNDKLLKAFDEHNARVSSK